MSADQKPEKAVALENGRVPANPSRMAQQLCGRIPASADNIFALHGRLPQPANAVHPIAPVTNNAPQNIVATGNPPIENLTQKTVSTIARKAPH